MKLFFDTEFTGLHKNTTLISIGIVSSDDREFYAEFTDYNKKDVDEWIDANVIENLYLKDMKPEERKEKGYVLGTRREVMKALAEWISHFDTVELVSDVCHYDMMLFIDLFGSAFDIPRKVCPACHDINQDIALYNGISLREAFDLNREEFIKDAYSLEDLDFPVSNNKHNALYDAYVIKEIYELIHDISME